MRARFGVLGAVEAHVGGRRLDLGPARQQTVLAVLLVEANTVVPTERLVDRVWGDSVPARPHTALRSYLSRLRGIAARSGGCTITHRSGGYVLEADGLDVDLHRFRHLVRSAADSGDDRESARRYEEAFALWRAEPFAGVESVWLDSVRDALQVELLAARLDYHDARLRSGEHTGLISALTALAEAHPLDERLAAQFMLALYRSGRQADALRHYRLLHANLAGELGTDPGLPVRRLHQRILEADHALDPVAPAAVPATPPSPVPRLLPVPPGVHVGRTEALALLDRRCGGTGGGPAMSRIAAISGIGGIGKTWLALHWAHLRAARFPDGQLYADLRGSGPERSPVPPESALRSFLHALGVAPEAVPVRTDDQVGLFRSVMADRRMLVVLDNAADEAQISPLLPGTAGSAVLVTSRRRLTGLVARHGAEPVELGPLPDDDARELLSRRLGGERCAGEPRAVDALVRHCSGLPLALSAAAARAAVHPEFGLTAMADELGDRTDRLHALETGDPGTSLRAVLADSHRMLSAPAAWMFGLLGAAPGPAITAEAAAALAGTARGPARAALRELESLHLVGHAVPGRFGAHDLVRAFAAERALDELDEADLAAARLRLVDFFLHSADLADRHLDPYRTHLAPEGPADGIRPHAPTDKDAASAWLEREHPCLMAVQRMAADHGWDTKAWQLARVLDTFHWRQGRVGDHLAAWRVGLDAAARSGDRDVQALAHRNLGQIHMQAREYAEGRRHLTEALTLAERAGDRMTSAHIHLVLVRALAEDGDAEAGERHGGRALELYRELGATGWEASAQNQLGVLALQRGLLTRAREHCETALTLHRAQAGRFGEAETLDSLGSIARALHDYEGAADYYHRALELTRTLGHAALQADALAGLGAVYAETGRPADAEQSWRRAAALYRAQQRTAEADEVAARLAVLG